MFLRRIILAFFMLSVITIINSAYGVEVVLFEEDFEDLTLEDSVMEGLARNKVWTDTPPDGWNIVDAGDKDGGGEICNGMREWDGWAFADAEWWTQTADDQNRSQFTLNGLAEGTIAIADPDEWDDANGPEGRGCTFNSWLSTPPINIAGATRNSLVLTFDSSWRPEDQQDAELTVSFDGDEEIAIMTMESIGVTTRYKVPEEGIDEIKNDNTQVNETLEFMIPNPKGSQTMVITWAVIDAINDWWWAVDNISLKSTDFAVSTEGKLASSWGSVKSQL
ncbi:hypothetical protein GF312_06520 [Candidatus Poribacteria bacterium]|nr:hypothetical protein [Candidatus Poribacteria bacterium]